MFVLVSGTGEICWLGGNTSDGGSGPPPPPEPTLTWSQKVAGLANVPPDAGWTFYNGPVPANIQQLTGATTWAGVVAWLDQHPSGSSAGAPAAASPDQIEIHITEGPPSPDPPVSPAAQ